MSERMTWGQGDYHLGGDPARAMFRGRAGVVVEIAPQKFMSWRMRATFGTVQAEREVEEIHSGGPETLRFLPGLTVVTFELTGTLDGRDDARPTWAANDAAEIEARRVLEQR